MLRPERLKSSRCSNNRASGPLIQGRSLFRRRFAFQTFHFVNRRTVLRLSMLTSVDARRRWFGSFFLILAGGLLIWGLTFLAPVLMRSPALFVAYWVTCFTLTTLSFVIAIYDFRVMRRRLREEQRSAFKKAFRDIIEEKEG